MDLVTKKIFDYVALGLSFAEIARELNTTRGTVAGKVKREKDRRAKTNVVPIGKITRDRARSTDDSAFFETWADRKARRQAERGQLYG